MTERRASNNSDFNCGASYDGSTSGNSGYTSSRVSIASDRSSNHIPLWSSLQVERVFGDKAACLAVGSPRLGRAYALEETRATASASEAGSGIHTYPIMMESEDRDPTTGHQGMGERTDRDMAFFREDSYPAMALGNSQREGPRLHDHHYNGMRMDACVNFSVYPLEAGTTGSTGKSVHEVESESSRLPHQWMDTRDKGLKLQSLQSPSDHFNAAVSEASIALSYSTDPHSNNSIALEPSQSPAARHQRRRVVMRSPLSGNLNSPLPRHDSSQPSYSESPHPMMSQPHCHGNHKGDNCTPNRSCSVATTGNGLPAWREAGAHSSDPSGRPSPALKAHDHSHQCSAGGHGVAPSAVLCL